MLKSVSFYIVAVIALSLLGCHHNDTSPPTCYPGQIVSVINTFDGQKITATTTFHYDDKMNLIEIQDDQGSLTFTYTDGRITSTLSTTSRVVETWSYDSSGRLSQIFAGPVFDSSFTSRIAYTQSFMYNSTGDLTGLTRNITSPVFATVVKKMVSNNGNTVYELTYRNNHDVIDSINFSAYNGKPSFTAPIAQALGNQKFYFLGSIANPLHVLKNDPTIQYSRMTGNGRMVYEYNTSGYPKKITTTNQIYYTKVESTITYVNCQ